MTEKEPSKNTKPSLWRSIAAPVVILVIALVLWGIIVSTETPVPDPPRPPAIQIQPPEERHEVFYQENIQPLMRAHERLNRESVKRVEDRIVESFERYSRGIEPFADDLTSWGTRIRIIANQPRDWWDGEEGNRTQLLIQGKFEKHILSENRLRNDLEAIFTDLRHELAANRNRALTKVRAAVDASQFPDVIIPRYDNYEAEVLERMQSFARGRAQDSVYHGIATLIVSELGMSGAE